MKLFYALLTLIILYSPLQAHDGCLFHDDVEPATFYNSLSAQVQSRSGLMELPVVFHVFDENISEEIILTQLKQLNQDFSGTNADINQVPDEFKNVIGRSIIRFELANISPEGLPTSGIVYHEPVALNSTNDIEKKIKEEFGWDANDYINIYVLDIPQSNVKGYAYLPTDRMVGSKQDGIVLDYTVVGSVETNNEGRSLTHEMGHYLGLFHTWGTQYSCNSDDGVNDTPLCSMPTYSCSPTAITECGQSKMFMNFMDYAPANCAVLFSAGQVQIMEQVVKQKRTSLIESGLYNKMVLDNLVSGEMVVDFAASSLDNWVIENTVDGSFVHTPMLSFKANEPVSFIFEANETPILDAFGVGNGILTPNLNEYFEIEYSIDASITRILITPKSTIETRLIFKTDLTNLKTLQVERKLTAFAITTSTEEAEISFQVGPNPTADFVQITSNEAMSFDLYVFDMNGQLILLEEVRNEKQTEVSLLNLVSGTYIFVLDEGKKRNVHKVLKI